IHSLLALLWIDYFTPLAAETEYDQNLKAFPIHVSATAIADELQRAYGSQLLEQDDRSVQFPTVKVVRKALDALVTIKLAMALPNVTGEYRVLYRQFNDDVLLRFASMLKTPAEKVTAQAELPFEETSAEPATPPKPTKTKRKKPASGSSSTKGKKRSKK
ncbi:MAG TPA: hypothetical protein VJZ00_16935, partial [Thermoanaerobaculia bacterium]|nr:hypothetical protein [Thermoanaerobaculia bacterium]